LIRCQGERVSSVCLGLICVCIGLFYVCIGLICVSFGFFSVCIGLFDPLPKRKGFFSVCVSVPSVYVLVSFVFVYVSVVCV